MPAFSTRADIKTALDAEGASESEVLSRFLFEYPEINEACQYNDGTTDRIDAVRAWAEFERRVLHRHPRKKESAEAS